MHKVAGVRIQIWIQVRIHDTAFRNDNIEYKLKLWKYKRQLEREKKLMLLLFEIRK